MTRRVLVTGAAGGIGHRFVRSDEAADLELVATDVVPGAELQPLDVTDPAACRAAVAGVDAVLHLAADPSPEADFVDTVVPLNLLGTYHLATAAVAAGVPRFVWASSIQAVAGYPLDHQPREDDPPRPRNAYGVGKAAGEALCASLAVTSSTTFVSVRIGHFRPERPGREMSLRDRMAWVSPGDLAQLFARCLTAPLRGHTVVHGISDNRPKQLSIEATRQRVGYAPVDDAFATLPADG
ncbi:NAD(P)-dependent oxidoreductase [Nitriliruptoraceae bacterium ZYF776]|nr:NAD(P)-dependent oxidoreductase [Profundirhabdus halotolerans]